MSANIKISIGKVEDENARCGYCLETFPSSERWVCGACSSIQHTECFEGTQSCLSLGCQNNSGSTRNSALNINVAPREIEGPAETSFEFSKQFANGILRSIFGVFILFYSVIALTAVFQEIIIEFSSIELLSYVGFIAISALFIQLGISSLLSGGGSFLKAFQVIRPPRPVSETHTQLTGRRRILAFSKLAYFTIRALAGFIFCPLMAIFTLYLTGRTVTDEFERQLQSAQFVPLLIATLVALIGALLTWVLFRETMLSRDRSSSIYDALFPTHVGGPSQTNETDDLEQS